MSQHEQTNKPEESKKCSRWKINPIILPPYIATGIFLPILIFGLIDFSSKSLMAVGIWSILYIFIMLLSLDNIWIYRRLPAMSPNHHKTVKVAVDNYSKTGDVYDEDSGITFRYHTKEKSFYISRTMYTDPKRFPKEYEERKYQFEARMNQARIPLEGYISRPNDPRFFDTYVRLRKRDASPENIARLRSVFIDLSAEDYHGQEQALNLAPDSSKQEGIPSLLEDVAWNFRLGQFDSEEEFVKAVIKYNEEVQGRNVEQILKEKITCVGAETTFVLFEDFQEEAAKVPSDKIHLSCNDGVSFTSAEILYKLNQELYPILEKSDFVFFEGFDCFQLMNSPSVCQLHLGS